MDQKKKFDKDLLLLLLLLLVRVIEGKGRKEGSWQVAS